MCSWRFRILITNLFTLKLGPMDRKETPVYLRHAQLGNPVWETCFHYLITPLFFSKSLPFFFIADDAFPLYNRIMERYAPGRGSSLTDEQIIFNYRISRARRCVENSFGILTSKWLCLSRTMYCQPDKAQNIVSTCCILHNLLMTRNRASYCPPHFADTYDARGNFIPGEWRPKKTTEGLFSANLSTGRGVLNRTIGSASSIREHLQNYCNSAEGSVRWQRKAFFMSEQ